MSGFNEQPEGATPLTHEDLQGLRLSWITAQGELNQAEAENVLRGRTWAFRRRPKFWYLADGGPELLHKQMFGDVWTWAGQMRRREANIGIAPFRISVELRNLREDTLAQIGDHAHVAYSPDELAMRFHHRLVAIHPFLNGNGRHSRPRHRPAHQGPRRRAVYLGRFGTDVRQQPA